MAATVSGVLLTGVHASRPASGVSVGTLYSCTTHSLIYQTSDTGATWTTWASLTGTGAVATDTIWDAAGDLVQGTGADTATKLSAGTAGQVLKSAGAAAANTWSSPGEFVTGNAKVATTQTTTSTSFADLATTGPSVTVTVGASGKVLLHIKSRMANTAADDCYIGVAVSGATTTAAATMLAISLAANKLGEVGTTTMITGLATGSTTFKMQYAVASGTGTFTNRELTVAPVI